MITLTANALSVGKHICNVEFAKNGIFGVKVEEKI